MVFDDVVDAGKEAVLNAVLFPMLVELELVRRRVLVQSTQVIKLAGEVAAGAHAGPVLWQGAPYSQQAKLESDEVDSGSITVVVVSVQLVVLVNCRAK